MKHPPRALATFLLLAAATVVPLRADDTALHEGAYGPEPAGGVNGPESIIRMESERLEIAFGRRFTTVRARFVFRSGKPDAPARQLVGFPDLAAGRKEAARRARDKGNPPPALGGEGDLTGPLEDVHTFVDGAEVPSELRYGLIRWQDGFYGPAAPGTEGAELIAWHAIPVEFPPHRDVVVERRYRVPNGASVGLGAGPQVFFTYTVATGGVWRGTIGELVADVRLKDSLTTKDLLWDLPAGAKDPDDIFPRTRPGRREWETLAPDHLRLRWRDFEPRTQANRRTIALWLGP